MPPKNAQAMPLSPYAALLVREGREKTVVISDLHIGWEVALTEKGFHIPSQTSKLLQRLKQLADIEKPDRLLILGDVKYAVEKIALEEWRDVPSFFEEALRTIQRIQVVPGNHDGNLEALLPKDVEVLSQRGTIIGDVGFFHGHTWPDLPMLGCSTLVIGHVHPVIVFRDPMGFRITAQVWVKAPCDGELLAKYVFKRHGMKLSKSEDSRSILETRFSTRLGASTILIMPSFNDFLGGRAVNRSPITREKKFEEFIGPVLRSGSVNLEKAEIFLLDGTFLGSLSDLRAMS